MKKVEDCIVPKKYRNYEDILDLDGDGVVTDEEIKKATEILRKATEMEKKEKDILKMYLNLIINNIINLINILLI